jgi:endonuclease G
MATGYDPLFLTTKINLPKLTTAQKKLQAPLISNKKAYELKYTHFSVVMNKERKFAFFAATNIDGAQWKAAVKERTKFVKDKAILPEYQTGIELYDLYKSKTQPDFDQGHIAKFQDPQWGDDATAALGATDSMYFTNCLPQHHSLNRGAWKSLEDYIVKQFTVDSGADGCKISVFAGPVLSDTDPFYIQKIDGKPFRIPCQFWKVIIFKNRKKKWSAVAFMMSQLGTLRKYNFVTDRIDDELVPSAGAAPEAEPEYFENFTSGEPYQVSISFVEQLTGLQFSLGKLLQPYKKQEATEIIFKRIEVPSSAAANIENTDSTTAMIDFEFEGITL